MHNNQDIWVLAEEDENGIRQCTFEALTETRRLVEIIGGQCCMVIIGRSTSEAANSLNGYPIDVIYSLDHPQLETYLTETYTSALAQLMKYPGINSPLLVIISATANGQDLAPRLAARLRMPLVTNCAQISIKQNKLGHDAKEFTDCPFIFIKPTHLDKIHTSITCHSDPPYMATLKPGALSTDLIKTADQTAGKIVVINPVIDPQPVGVKVLKHIKGDPKTMDLREAERIIAGGRGVENAKGWQMVEELGEAMGASVGGSRMALDMGFVDRQHSIGQTGKSIHPKLYIAAGISGSEFHMSAVHSEHIIAINSDRRASIFNYTQLGICGNLHDIFPILTQNIRELRSKKI